MIECYYKWCIHHDQNEPFCSNMECTASPDSIRMFQSKRQAELNEYEATRKQNKQNCCTICKLGMQFA